MLKEPRRLKDLGHHTKTKKRLPPWWQESFYFWFVRSRFDRTEVCGSSDKARLAYLPQPQPQLLLSQPQLFSQPQLCSQQQLGSQQPQLRWQRNMLQRPSSKQQRWQQHELPHDSQPQLFSQPQLCSQPQLFSQQQLFSQPQLCSQQPQPQPQLLQRNMPQTRSQRPLKQQRWQQQVLQQLDSQPQLFSQPQLCSQPQLFSQQQLFSQPQLCSQPQPQPQPQLPPSRPKKAFALPAEPSTRATTSVAEARHRFIGTLLKYGEGKTGRVVSGAGGVRDRRWKARCPVLRPRTSDPARAKSRRFIRRQVLSTRRNC